MMHYRGFYTGSRCFGYGFFNNGWNWLIVIGVLLIVITITYLLISRNRKTTANNETFEALKIKFVQGEITEEEYKRRKNVIKGK